MVAYQAANIGIGGGSLYIGGSKGFGVAFTYADIEDPSGGASNLARISNSALSDYDMVSIVATDRSRILAGAAVAGGGSSSDSIAGSFVLATVSRSTEALLTADTLRPATATPPPLADTWPLIRTSPSATILIDPPEAMIAAPVRRPLLLTLLAN